MTLAPPTEAMDLPLARAGRWSAGSVAARVGSMRTGLIEGGGSVAAGAVLSVLMIVGMALAVPGIILLAGILGMALAVARPAIGLTVLAVMIPLREPGIFPPVLLNFVMAAATCAGCLFRLPIERPRVEPSAGFLLLVGYLLFSVVTLPPIVSGAPLEQAETAVNQFLQLSGGFLVFIAGYLTFQRYGAVPLLMAGVLSAGFAALLGIVFLAAGTDAVPFRALFSGAPWVARSVGPFFNTNYYAEFLAFAVLLATGVFGIARWRLRVVLVPIMSLLLAALFLSFSRGGILTLAAGLVAWAFVRNLRLGIAVLMTLVVLAAIVYPLFIETRLDLTVGPRSDRAGSLTANDTTRLDAFGAGFRLFEEAPVFGIGFGLYQYASADFIIGASTTYPHNAGIKVLAEQGIVGLVIAISVLALLGRSILRSTSPLRRTAWAVFVAYAVGSVFLEPFWSLQTSGLVWLLYGAVLSPRPEHAANPLIPDRMTA